MRRKKKQPPTEKKEEPEQLDEGIWSFVVQASPAKTGYVYARSSGGSYVETFVSTSSSALMFQTDTELVKTSQSFSSRDAFLTWACQQLGGGTLHVWDTSMTSQSSTFACS